MAILEKLNSNKSVDLFLGLLCCKCVVESQTLHLGRLNVAIFMTSWISTPRWALRDALENLFLRSAFDPKDTNFGETVDLVCEYINNGSIRSGLSPRITVPQRRWVDGLNAFLKNALRKTGVDGELSPVVWLKLAINLFAIDDEFCEKVYGSLLEQRQKKEFRLNEFYVIRGVDAVDINSKVMLNLLESNKLMPLDIFFISPIGSIDEYAADWRLIVRHSVSYKFSNVGGSQKPAKTKRERLGMQYYDRTKKIVEELCSQRVSRKISKDKVTVDGRYAFKGTRRELLNILRKHNPKAFRLSWDAKAEDVLSDVVCCSLK